MKKKTIGHNIGNKNLILCEFSPLFLLSFSFRFLLSFFLVSESVHPVTPFGGGKGGARAPVLFYIMLVKMEI